MESESKNGHLSDIYMMVSYGKSLTLYITDLFSMCLITLFLHLTLTGSILTSIPSIVLVRSTLPFLTFPSRKVQNLEHDHCRINTWPKWAQKNQSISCTHCWWAIATVERHIHPWWWYVFLSYCVRCITLFCFWYTSDTKSLWISRIQSYTRLFQMLKNLSLWRFWWANRLFWLWSTWLGC